MIKYKDYVISPNECGGYALSKFIPATEDRKQRSDVINYPSTLESAIKTIQRLEFGKKVDSGTFTLGEAIAELRIITKDLENSFKDFKGV